MKKRRIPGTELDISVVGMGTWTVSGKYWGSTDDAVSRDAIRAALAAGINWFDTAPLYGDGHADRLLRDALGPDLNRVILASKVGVRTGSDGHAVSDLSPAHVRADCERSLRRLREPIDLLQVHWPCQQQTPLDDTIDALEDLQSRGWIRHWGLCNYGPAAVRQAKARSMATLQTPYSLVRREFETELREVASEVGVLAYETLCRGLLSGKFPTLPSFPDSDQRSRDDRFRGPHYRHVAALTRDLGAVAGKLGVSTAAVAVGWVVSRPGVTAAIVGARTPEQIEQVARASALVGRPRIASVIERIAAVHGPPPRP